jgi:hypothetical protein
LKEAHSARLALTISRLKKAQDGLAQSPALHGVNSSQFKM